MSQDDIGYGFIDEDEAIEHHGVKGMKWGVRKRRPTTGRRVSAKEASKMGQILRRGASGVKKYASAGAKFVANAAGNKASRMVEKHNRKKEAKETRKKYKLERGKKLKGMSDEELNQAINRMRKEAEYRELTKTRGEKMRAAATETIKNAAISATTTMVGNAVNAALGEYRKEKSIKKLEQIESLVKAGKHNKITPEDLKPLIERDKNVNEYFRLSQQRETGDFSKNGGKGKNKSGDKSGDKSGNKPDNESNKTNEQEERGNSEKSAPTSSLESKVTSAIKSVPMDTSWQEYSRYSTKYVDASRYNLDNADYYRHKDWYDKHGEW